LRAAYRIGLDRDSHRLSLIIFVSKVVLRLRTMDGLLINLSLIEMAADSRTSCFKD
jgi:hypothetical protein